MSDDTGPKDGSDGSGDKAGGGAGGGYKVSARLLNKPVMPDAGVVRTDCPEGDCAERQPLPAAVTRKPDARKTPAEWAYERLILYVQKFEEQLDADHEVGMGFAGSDAGSLHIKGMGYFAPDMITFYGIDPSGQRTQLIQHVSQLNVMLKAAPKLHETAERIGFHLRAGLEGEVGEEGGAGEQTGPGDDPAPALDAPAPGAPAADAPGNDAPDNDGPARG